MKLMLTIKIDKKFTSTTNLVSVTK